MILRTILTGFVAGSILISTSGCRKEEPVPVTGDPVFYVNGTLNGSPLLLRAGVDNYYMYSNYSSDQQNVYTFSGTLKVDGSNDPSPNSLKISISDSRASAPSPALIDSAIFPGTYFFSQTQSSPLAVQFTSTAVGDVVLGYTWDFGDGNYSSAANPTHVYSIAGIYTVSLSTQFIHNNIVQADTVSGMVNVGLPGVCSSSFTASNIFSNAYLFQATGTGGNGPYTFNWDFGDGYQGTGDSLTHLFVTTPPDSVCTVTLLTIDANNDTFITRQNIALSGATGCYSNFTTQAVITSSGFSSVTVEWTDAAGVTYSSAGGVGMNNSFQVISVEEYAPNENGQRTKKVRMLITCTLFNGINAVQLTNTEVVFALAYP